MIVLFFSTQVRLALVCVLGPLNIILALLSWWKMGYFVLNVIGTNKNFVREFATANLSGPFCCLPINTTVWSISYSGAYRIRSFFQTMQFFHVELFVS